MKTVAILAPINKPDTRYSVAGVVLDLARVLADNGHRVKLLVREGFELDSLPGIEIYHLPNYSKDVGWETPVEELDVLGLEQYAFETGSMISTLIADCSSVLTHDIVFNPQFLWLNMAARQAAESQPAVCWVHWTHSLPLHFKTELYPRSLCRAPWPNARFVALSHTGIRYIAKFYDIPEHLVSVVHNFVLPAGVWGMDKLTASIWGHVDRAEIVMLTAGRLSPGKQLHKSCTLLASMRQHADVRGLFVFSYTQGEEKRKEFEELCALRDELGLSPEHLVFLQDLKDLGDLSLGLDRDQVQSLMRGADVFVHSSYAESFGLTVLEAAAAGCFMVLNDDVPVFQEFAGIHQKGFQHTAAYLLSFGSYLREVSYQPTEHQWYADRGRELVDVLRANPQHQAKKQIRTRYNGQWVYENQLQPLL
jgi:glycosyltransferase involved in cell wall biosynthesis